MKKKVSHTPGYKCEEYVITDCCDADMGLQAAAPELLAKVELYADDERARIAEIKESKKAVGPSLDEATLFLNDDFDDQIRHHSHLLAELEKLIAKAKGEKS